ncbi:MAG: helix-turn-helix domain-containing protein [Bacillota bacterium]|nr:helix-turn-helix domain-containing protein [Bacillota bacterium]
MYNLKTDKTEQPLLAQYSLKLLDALAGEVGLKRLVEIGYDMLGNTILVIDLSLKTIAHLKNSNANDDPVWNEFVNVGYPSLSLVNRYNKLAQLINQSESSFLWSDPYSKYPRIMSKIQLHGKQIAALSIIAHEKPFEDTDFELTDLLAKAISIELQKNKFIKFSQGLMHEHFFEELFSGKIRDKVVIKDRIKTLNLNLKKNLYTLTLDISSFDNSKTSLYFLRNEIERKIPNSKAVIHDDYIVLIVGCDNKKQFLNSTIIKFKDFLKSNILYAGISRSYHGLEEVQEHYLQSLNALRLGRSLNKEEYFYTYEEYALYHFVESCYSIDTLKKNCHPSLIKLMEYDKEHKTNYTQSIHTYLIHSKNVTESANALNIHRNTMFYRLEKIQEITDMDINNNDTSLHLQLSFKMLELLKIDLP